MKDYIDKIELGWKYNQKSLLVKGKEEEINILKKAVSKKVLTPYTYDRLSIILYKQGKIKEVISVCEEYQKILNERLKLRKDKGYSQDISFTERAIMNRLKRFKG